MRYTIRRGGVDIGIFTVEEIQAGFSEGRFLLSDKAVPDGEAEGIPLSFVLGSAMTMPMDRPEFLYPRPGAGARFDPAEAARLRGRLAGYEKLSGIVWMIIAVVQCLSIVGAIAGIWNVFAALTRFRLARAIGEGRPGVVEAYEESLSMLIVMGCVNFFLGGFIAAAWIGFDFYVRHKVLGNRHLFAPPA